MANESSNKVQPVESSNTVPTQVQDTTVEDLKKQLADANDRADKAEAAAEALKPEVVPVAPNPTGRQEQLYEDGKELCWNCVNHGKKNILPDDGVCPECGFDKEKLYNGNIEAEKATQFGPR